MRGVLFADTDAAVSAEVAQESKQFATNPSYRALSVHVDVTDICSVQAMVDLAVAEFGRVDYCVNAAGVSRRL